MFNDVDGCQCSDPKTSYASMAKAGAPSRMWAAGVRLTLLLGLLFTLLACATYGERVAPVPFPEAQSDHVDVDGAKVVARAFTSNKEANQAFGFDIRGAGLFPIRFVIDNQTPLTARVRADQTFLIDDQGQAWPLLTAEQAYQRVHSHVELGETAKGAGKPAMLLGAAGALAGMAVGIVTGQNIGEITAKGAAAGAAAGALYGGTKRHGELEQQIRQDLLQESLRNERIRPGELAYGYLFFPGKKEANSAKALRLGLNLGEKSHIITVTF
ncbi:hypothetical protein [Nitrosococcus watsonii]|uniref:Uncharacterized protein n=1 Tax=Nitrosococcus watsoni (strain C-113) TaxID=105559 RepID=D8K6B7_NITWC|nr:hypothetical protein [Nitrosococcus watsonii]ADJ28444.1 conserved hypothetical protein [Nitrosococcus watsonii C-113]